MAVVRLWVGAALANSLFTARICAVPDPALGVAIKFALAGGLKVKEPVASKPLPLPLPANGACLAVS